MAKIRVGVLFGGKSAEHEVSLQSARNVMAAINREKYEVVPIGIDKKGRWFLGEEATLLAHAENPSLIRLNRSNHELAVRPGHRDAFDFAGTDRGAVDVVFPVLHGPFGEDGAVQGLLKLAGIPCVGAGVLGSAVGMDKDVMKRLLRDAQIPIAPFVTLHARDRDARDFEGLSRVLGTPMFVKPANLGSSVGVHKVRTADELAAALDDAFSWDRKVVVEQNIVGREVECAVLGDDDPRASVVGEVVTEGAHDFYSYDAKYIDGAGSRVTIPAQIDDETAQRVRDVSLRAFRALDCSGLARVDSFVAADGSVFVNEINTLPGFTNVSMYPKLWEASGMSQAELIDELIRLALERHAAGEALRTSR